MFRFQILSLHNSSQSVLQHQLHSLFFYIGDGPTFVVPLSIFRVQKFNLAKARADQRPAGAWVGWNENETR